jgi:hypothetical protein
LQFSSRIGDAFDLANVGYADGTWRIFSAMNGRPSRVQFAAERVMIAKLAMVRLGVRVCGCANVLKIVSGQRRFVRRQRMLRRPACTEKKRRESKAG